MGEHVERLKQHLYRYHDLQAVDSILGWDQEVYMPPQGFQARGEQMATISAMAHEIFTSAETGRLLEAAEAEVAHLDYDSDEASLVRVIRRDYDKMTKIPTELIAERARITTQAFGAWREAREQADYAIFQPHLQNVVDWCYKVIDILGYQDHPYDTLLDFFEPGMTTAEVTRLFGELKAGLVPLLQDIVNRGQPVDDSFFNQEYPEERQWDVSMAVLREIGYDFTRGRQDKTAHPFTTTFSINDVRVTNRFTRTRPQSSFFSAVHEGGHALYEQGVNPAYERTALMGGATLGVHESQSRLWENIVGRSRAFWRYFLPVFRAFFPEQVAGISLEQFYRALNKVEPSFIRVEADEVTYNMHIFVRFELEQALITGDLHVADVPEAWNAKYQSYLGVLPPNDALGCLQDVHWSHGTLGYFPTYALGNLMAAQLYEQAKHDIPDLEETFARGEFNLLLNWLREKVHRHGAKFTAKELMQRVTGGDIEAQPLLNFLRTKYTEIYEL